MPLFQNESCVFRLDVYSRAVNQTHFLMKGFAAGLVLKQRHKVTRNHGSCIHHLGLDNCFDEFNYHDSLQARLAEGIGHFIVH